MTFLDHESDSARSGIVLKVLLSASIYFKRLGGGGDDI